MKTRVTIPTSGKVSIIGCGHVGMATAYALVLMGSVRKLVLVSTHGKEALGEQLDLDHALPFLDHCVDVSVAQQYSDIAGSDVVIIAAGAPQKPGESRLDLATENTEIIERIIPQIVAVAPQAIIIMVTNPVDVLTYKAYQLAGLPKGRIFGTGTALDTARFKFHLSEMISVSPHSVHAYIIGEHGDSSVPIFSSAMVGGQPLALFDGFDEQDANRAYDQVKNAAAEIRQYKGYTSYGIGTTTAYLVEQILADSKVVLPVSVPLHRYLGESGVALSVPCVIGRNGAEKALELKVSWDEKQAFARSAEIVRKYC